jgi:hypothetical protein
MRRWRRRRWRRRRRRRWRTGRRCRRRRRRRGRRGRSRKFNIGRVLVFNNPPARYITYVHPSMDMHWKMVSHAHMMLSKLVMPKLGRSALLTSAQ